MRFRNAARLAAVLAVVAMVAAACGGGGGGGTGGNSPSAGAQPKKGGTLNVITDQDVFGHWDPQQEYFQTSFTIYDCCILRTLMGYNGLPQDQHGTEVFPDLASAPPTVSSDGLTWTFHLRPGLHYSPPLQSVPITSQDIVRALEREGDPNVAAGYPFYYDVIQGFSDYSSGKAKTISGLSTPDANTLVVKLTQPTGDLGYRFALPATAPIPPNPYHPNWKLGVAQGHDTNYGSYMVSTGPYMWAGSQNLNFKLAPSKQPSLSGLSPGKSWTFVRNPSWSASSDPLRPAYVNEIQVSVQPSSEATVDAKEVLSGQYDYFMANTIPPAILSQVSTNPQQKPLMHINPAPGNYFLAMNLATPPFDDLNLRKAVQTAVDKAAIQRIEGGPTVWPIATHFVPDILLTTSNGTDLMKGYDPYPTPGNRGDDTAAGLAAAKKYMAQSKYGDSSGMCVAAACKNVLTLGGNTGNDPAMNTQIASNLAKIGITLDLKQLNGSAVYAKIGDPKNHIPFALSPGWLEDYPDAFTFFFFPTYGPSILPQYNSNYSLMGATPAQLESYGYRVTSVPSMNAEINKCMPMTGDTRIQCWANADKYLMESIASIVPLTFNNTVNLVSPRVENYQYNPYFSGMALDRVWLMNA